MAEPTTHPIPRSAQKLMARINAEYQRNLQEVAEDIATDLGVDNTTHDAVVNFDTGLVTVTPKPKG